MGACPEAIEWVGTRTLKKAWAECQRGDWMLWLVHKNYGKPGWPKYRQVVLCACEVAEQALRYVPKYDERPRLAIEAARRCAKNPTNDNKAAAKSAAKAAASVAWAAAWAAASAASADIVRKWLKLAKAELGEARERRKK